mmetsp:Transcript_5394/g.19587  ORF Transcript_5394/g.19587 Transcript_5394/m.19587 type:complete len:433 (-) Transcript_5394:69-1367(-)
MSRSRRGDSAPRRGFGGNSFSGNQQNQRPGGGGGGGARHGGFGGNQPASQNGSREQPDVRLCKFFLTGGSSNCKNTSSGGCGFSHCLQRVADVDSGGGRANQQQQGQIKALATWKNEAGVHVFAASKDGHWRMWNAVTWALEQDVDMEGEIGCLTVSNGWLLCGYEGATPLIPNVQVGHVRAWNLGNPAQTLNMHISEQQPYAHAGRVYSVAMRECAPGAPGNGDVYTAGHEGNIHAWVFNAETSSFVVAGRLEGHVLGVTALRFWGTNFLVSASMDKTLRIWNCDDPARECQMLLTANNDGHSDAVTCVANLAMGGTEYFMSGSMDASIKIWGPQATCEFTQKTAVPVLSLEATMDAAGKPICVIGLMDSTVELRQPDLGFRLRATLSSRFSVGHVGDVRALCCGDQYFCSGASDGKLMVWQWVAPLPDPN